MTQKQAKPETEAPDLAESAAPLPGAAAAEAGREGPAEAAAPAGAAAAELVAPDTPAPVAPALADAAPAPAESAPETVIALPSVVDLPRAGDLYDRLAAAPGDVVLEAERVQFIGAAALQVLLAAATDWHARGHRLALREPSSGFLACAGRLGIDPADFTQGAPS